MNMLMITVDGEIAGYVSNDPQGRDVADRYVLEHYQEAASVVPVDRIPQGARRLDR